MRSLRGASLGFAIVLLTSSLSPLVAHATWSHDPYLGNTAVCTSPGNQSAQAAVSDGAGGVIVTWTDLRSGTNDIYAQRLNAAGVPLWTSNGVPICVTTGFQDHQQIVSDGAGGAIIVWQDTRGVDLDIYAQRVNSAGVVQWTPNGVAVCTQTGTQFGPQIVSDGANGAITTWIDHRGTTYDIYAARVLSNGTLPWSAGGVAVCTVTNDQTNPTIATDGAGGAIIAWQDFRSGSNQDVYAQRVTFSGAFAFTAGGQAMCVATADQIMPVVASDGSGGAYVAWEDFRSGSSYDIYAQHVTSIGSPQWTIDGAVVSNATGDQINPVLSSDGFGGACLVWDDFRSGTSYDIYAQRLTPGGGFVWAANGLALCTATNTQFSPACAADGAGGAVVAWHDFRNGQTWDVYAQHVTQAGGTTWTFNGAGISLATSDQLTPSIVGDGAGGAIVIWQDDRAVVTEPDIYAQRIEKYGNLGNPEPSIVSVKDVPNDQGGSVKVGWNASYLDADPYVAIYEYRVWRSAPPNLLSGRAMLARGVTDDPDLAASTGKLLAMPASTSGYLWELVARQPAFELSGYSVVTATTSDSIGAGNPRTAFMVEAAEGTSAASDHFFSAPDSGYSVDNLPPAGPAPFFGNYSGGVTDLHWDPNRENDLAGYRLYRGTSSGFVPDPSSLISAQADTGYADAGIAGRWYKLSAIDVHGNESVFAVLGPSGTTDAPPPGAVALFFAPPSPNPSASEATFRFGLPAEGAVSVTVFDERGRAIRSLAHGTLGAGEHLVRWDGRDDAGHEAPSGLYFARLEHGGRSLVVRALRVR